MKPASIKPVRCAIYPRVSTEHFRLRDKWPSDQGPETTCTLRALDAVKHSTAPPRPPPASLPRVAASRAEKIYRGRCIACDRQGYRTILHQRQLHAPSFAAASENLQAKAG